MKSLFNKHGIEFVIRASKSHIHLEIDENVKVLLNEISSLEKRFVELEYDFQHVIGETTCVETSDKDEIVYAQRKQRKGYSRFVLNRDAEETSYITGVFLKSEGKYVIISLYHGKKSGKEPYDRNAKQADFDFWKKHALIYNLDEIIKGSEMTVCPW